MLTCRNGLGIYVSCHGKRLTVYRSVLLHNDSLWISSYYFSYSVITYRRDKVTPLRKKTLSLLFYGTVGFAGYGFLVFYGQQLAGPSGAIHAAMIQSLMPLIALLLQWITKNKRPQNYTFLCMFVALIGVMLVISKGNIHLLFGAASHLSTNILMLCGVTCWVIYTNGGASFQSWSPLRYTTLTCLFGSISLITIVTFLTYTNVVTVPSLSTIMNVRFELLYMSIIAGVIAVFLLERRKSLYFIY